MHLIVLAAATLISASTIAGCADGSTRAESPEDSPASTSTSTPASTGEAVPDGTYAKTVTKADAKGAGITDQSFLSQLGGRTTFTFKFAGKRWTEFVSTDGAAPEPGDLGTLEYDTRHDVSMLSESDGSRLRIHLRLAARRRPADLDRHRARIQRHAGRPGRRPFRHRGQLHPAAMRSLAPAVALALALGLAACTDDSDGSEPVTVSSPTSLSHVRWHGCDAAIESTFLSQHRCGTLTVPQDRHAPSGPTLDLAVLQVWPVGVEPAKGLATGFADNVGDPRAFGGAAAAGATRLHHVGVEVAFRGTLPSSPALTCPEVDALTREASALPDDDPGLRTRCVARVRACADRLRAAGVEPGNFDSAAAAADVDDLRRAMGVDSWWGAGSYGTQSRVLFRYLHDYPGKLKAAWLDSPWFPDTDDLTGGALGTRSALAQLFSTCAHDRRCHHRHANLKETWERALDRTARSPLEGTGRDQQHQRVPVLVDDAKLLRFVRYSLGGDGPENLTWLPQTITDAAAGRLNRHLADLVANDPLFCAGYRPQCVHRDGFAWGVYLTSLCHDQLPGLDKEALHNAIDSQTAYEQVFGRSPYLQVCEAWRTPGDEPSPPPDPDGASLLLIPGQFDSFSRPEWSKVHASAWPHAWTFTAPNNTHNTLGYGECALAVRNAWAAAPTSPPDPQQCTTPPSLTFR